MNQPQLRNGSFTRQFNGAPAQGGVWPRFFMHTVTNELASQQAGHEVFKDIESVEFNFPGNPHTKPVFAVAEEHRQRWPQEYEAFKKGNTIAINGTPIDVLPFLRPSMVKELKALDIMTAEQLAALDDHGVQRIHMGGRKMKELAAAYLDSAKEVAIVSQLHSEIEKKDVEIADLRLKFENLQEQMQRSFAQMQERLNAPHPMMTMVPAHSDPFEAQRQLAKPVDPDEAGAFDGLPTPPPKRRRPQTEPAA
jgi:hypothetical protein